MYVIHEIHSDKHLLRVEGLLQTFQQCIECNTQFSQFVLLKERTSGQYQAAISNALQDSRRIINLIDGLLNLAKADYQSEQITMEEVRLDELLLDARELVLKAHPDYHIELVFEQEAEEDNVLTISSYP